MTGEPLDLVLWPGVLGALTFEAQLQIAQAGGFTSLAVNPLVARTLMKNGVTPEAARRMAQDHGVRLDRLDGMSSWAPVWHLPTTAPTYARYHERFNFSAEECLDIAEAFGMTSIVAVGLFDHGSLAPETLVESFASFCAQARSRRMRVELEFIPHLGIRTLSEAWHIVREAAAPDSGLMLDTWHLCKSPSDLDADLALLDTLPAQVLASMQLTDAVNPHKVADPFAELVAEGRGLPGEGHLPIARVIALLDAKGGLRNVGPEPSCQPLLELTPAHIGERAGSLTRAALAAARGGRA